MKSDVKKSMIAFSILIGVLISWARFAEALEPRLLWEKKLPFKTDDIRMATRSGDIILYSQEARQIILYDKSGNKRFHWGPRIDRQPMGVSISYDGDIISFVTAWTEDYIEKKKIDTAKLGWDKRVHYVTRNGKELWNRQISGTTYLSPNGKMVAIGPSAGEGKDLTLLDSQGKISWKYTSREAQNIAFSPDSDYISFLNEGGLNLLDKTGRVLWTRDEVKGSLTEGANSIITDKRVYDKQGNVILEMNDVISFDGSKLTVIYPDKVQVLSWPDKTVLREYSFITRGGVDVSYNDRILAVSGKVSTSLSNLFVFDTATNTSWDTRMEPNFYFFLSYYGNYLLVVSTNSNKLLFYEIQ